MKIFKSTLALALSFVNFNSAQLILPLFINQVITIQFQKMILIVSF